MRRFLRDNGLSVALFTLFFVSYIGQGVAGWLALSQDMRVHGQEPLGLLGYLRSGHFLSATFENWESEFLQMAVYVLLTALLVQKGSPGSRKPGESVEARERPPGPDSPWPVHRGGLLLRFYAHSLTIALTLLFVLSFSLHLVFSNKRTNEEAARHHQPLQTIAETATDPEFWFESFQNWQSEFLSIGVLMVLGIFLRERGSTESKAVAAPNEETGEGA
jgi:hypothetical protein